MKEKPLLISVIHILIAITIFIVPIFFTKQFVFLFTPEKTFLFYTLTEILFFLWIYVVLSNKEYLPPWSAALIAGASFLGIYTLSGILSTSPEISFWSTISRMSGLILLYHIAAFIIVLSATVRDEKTWRLIFYTSVISGGIVAFFSYLGTFGLKIIEFSPQSSSLIGNTSYEAVYLLFNIFIAIFILSKEKNVKRKLFLKLIIILIFFCPLFFNFNGIYQLIENPMSLLGEARAATLSLWVGLIFLGFLRLARSSKKYLQYTGIVASVGIVILTITGVSLMIVPNTIPHSIVSQENPGVRLILWDIAQKGISEKPLLGWGPENYFAPFYKYFDPVFFTEQWRGIGANNDKPHNAYLEIAIGGGILGLIFYLIFFYFLFSELIRKDIQASEKSILLALLFAYLVQNAFFFDVLVSYLMLAVVIAYIVSKKTELYEEINTKNTVAYLYVLLPIFIVMFWILVYSPYTKQTLLAKAVEDSKTIDRGHLYQNFVTQPLDANTSMLIFLTDGTSEAITGNLAILNSDKKEKVLKEVRNLRISTTAHIETNPKHYQLLLSLVKLIHVESLFYNDSQIRNNLLLMAEKYEERLSILSPSNPQNYWVKAQRQLLQGKSQEARDTLNQAKLLYPEVEATNNMLSSIEDYENDQIVLPYFQY